MALYYIPGPFHIIHSNHDQWSPGCSSNTVCSCLCKNISFLSNYWLFPSYFIGHYESSQWGFLWPVSKTVITSIQHIHPIPFPSFIVLPGINHHLIHDTYLYPPLLNCKHLVQLSAIVATLTALQVLYAAAELKETWNWTNLMNNLQPHMSTDNFSIKTMWVNGNKTVAIIINAPKTSSRHCILRLQTCFMMLKRTFLAT